MSVIVETSLNLLNFVIDKSPKCISDRVGKFPIKSSGNVEIPFDFFSGWLNLDHTLYESSLPALSTMGDACEKLKGGEFGYRNIHSKMVHLYGPVTIMPEISLGKKVICAAAIIAANSALVYLISNTAFKAIAGCFSKQQKKEAMNVNQQKPLDKATLKTVKTISVILSLITAIAVGRVVYDIFCRGPGIFSRIGFTRVPFEA